MQGFFPRDTANFLYWGVCIKQVSVELGLTVLTENKKICVQMTLCMLASYNGLEHSGMA